MSFFANTALSEPISLPIGSIRKTVMVGYNVGDLATGVANTTIVTENGIWIVADAVYSQASYPELYSQLGLFNASVFTRKSTITPPLTVLSGDSIMRLGYGNSLYVASTYAGYSTSTDLNTWIARGTATRTSIKDVAYGNGVYVYCGDSGTIGTIEDITTNEWTARTSGTTSTLRAIKYGAGLFVVCGDGGALRTSTDGITWTARTSGTTSILYNVLYNNGLFIYVGAGGVLRTSTDGITWAARTSGTTQSLFALAYGGGLYLYGGGGGVLSTSTDGITWTARTSGTTSTITTIAYGNGIYALGSGAALINSTTNLYKTSTDGITWTAGNGGYYSTGGGSSPLGRGVRVIYGNGYFLAQYTAGSTLDHQGTAYASANANFAYQNINNSSGPVYEFDGKNIHANDGNFTVYQNGFYIFLSSQGKLSYANSVNMFDTAHIQQGRVKSTPYNGAVYGSRNVYDNGTFLLNGTFNEIYTSTNGVNWNDVTSDLVISPSYQGKSISYVNGLYMLSGYGVLTSTNLINWTGKSIQLTAPSTTTLLYGNGTYWCIPYESSFNPSYFYLTSQNVNSPFVVGTSVESPRTTGSNTILAGTFGNNTYVIAGTNGRLNSKTDGLTWFVRTSGTTSTINALTYGNGLFTYAGNGGVLRTSTDGTTWDARTSGTTSIIRALTYGNGVYAYAGDGGVLRSSTDGITWTARTSGTTSIIRALTYGNSTYVYAGDGGVLSTSTDGTTWTARTSGTASAIFTLIYGDGLYVYGGGGGVLATSTNGTTWTARTSGTTSSILSMMYGNGVYFYWAVDQLWNSTDAITWYPYNANTGSDNAIVSSSYGNGVYCFWTYNGTVVTTTDFNSWNKYPITSANMTDCVYGNGYFVAARENSATTGYGNILVSQDAAQTWTTILTNPNQAYFSINYRNGLFSLVGAHGTLGSNSYIATCNTHINDPTLANSWITRITGTTSTNPSIIYGNNEYVIFSQQNYMATTANTQQLNYANGYDASINFYIPGFTGTGNFGTVTTSYSQPAQRVFIKAKNV